MDKKTIKKISLILLVFVLIGIVLYFVLGNEKTDANHFKSEYESLNNQKNEQGKKYLNMSVPKDNNIKYASYDEVIKLLTDGTGVLYLGYPECPWCRNAVPTLLKAAKESEVENIYYFNALSIRDEKKLDAKGKVVTTKEGTKEYYKLVDKLKDYLPLYDGLKDESIKRIYFPTTVFVMGGKVVGIHESTVSSQKDPYKKMTEAEETELLKIYKDNISKIYGTCDESC